MDTVDLLLHPVRLRVVHAMADGRAHTTAELCARLPDVSRATIYRHVGVLADAGVLEVVKEERVHGAVERQYQLSGTRPRIGVEAAEAMSRDDHRRGFAAAMAVLLAEFDAYLDRDQAAPVADLVSYRQATLWLSHDELADMINEMRQVLLSRQANRPAPGRAPHLLGTILFPTAEKES
ncbi:helix-turn-helix domain-containing protein [Solihabitans fulvus]|uniref:Helix-turn-helix domain-containing protein n=1 Tax=Solihabitans fulvus TaxID=1892852 RepID=A0A5B2XB12_9PSEU|nr:helix-turn-helix domain-containing protein [Solihabitans fulvus]KAA2260139.1 helix-turn-helix domain-containing protein [Solihabitans fulvus]